MRFTSLVPNETHALLKPIEGWFSKSVLMYLQKNSELTQLRFFETEYETMHQFEKLVVFNLLKVTISLMLFEPCRVSPEVG